MESLPKSVNRIIKRYLPFLLSWFSAYLMDLFIQRQPDHHLVQFNDTFDFSRLIELYDPFRPPSRRGSGIDHTTEQLIRAIYVKYHYDYSYRQTEHAIRNNLLIRWFVGYGLHQQTPDHSMVHRFDSWIRQNHPESFHLEMMRQIDSHFPEEKQEPQIGDTFATNAHAAVKLLPDLLRDACQQIFNKVLAIDLLSYTQLCATVDKDALFGKKGQGATFFLKPEKFQERCQNTAMATLAFLDLLRLNWHWFAHFSPADRKEMLEIMAVLEKILHDEFSMVHTQGQVVNVTLKPADKKGSYRIRSATDPDATFRVHNDKINFGYNVNVLGTKNFVREIHVATGAEPDAKPLDDILASHFNHYGFYPPKLIYDKAAGTGKHVALIDEVTNGQTQLVVKLIDYDKRTKRFKPTDFELSADNLTLTCPNGQSTKRKYRHGAGDGYTYRFMPAHCQGCPLKTLIGCRGKPDIPITPRNVFISDYGAPRQKALAYSKTPPFKEDMKLRNQIERVIAGLVLYSGARNARVRRIEKVQFQLNMNAMAYNAKRWINKKADKKAAPAAA